MDDDKWTPAVIGTLAGALFGVIATTASQYFITYKGIEEPKIMLDTKKAEIDFRKSAIDAYRQALTLSPSIETKCGAKSLDTWTWYVFCSVKNSGAYHADIQIVKSVISISSDINEITYESGKGFDVNFPNKKQGFRAYPGDTGDLWFYIKFDKNRYENGIRQDLTARINLSYTTIESAKSFFLQQFPELSDFVKDIGIRGQQVLVELPPPQLGG